ncbi:MAG TPA: FAD-dependent oxidoreductase [Jatrophihabitans sp.]|nr:FAD-dependent oxidoreductase [Jatrophihabitans sp.]
MRIVVVGSGVIGLLTATECVRAGADVDLVEQSGIPAPGAASYDRHRVVRTFHRGDATLTIAAADLVHSWHEVDRRFGARTFHRTGVVTLAPVCDVDAALVLLAGVGAPVQALSGHELRRRYPHVRFAADDTAVLEPAAGTVRADHALHAVARWLRGQPAVELHPHRRAVRVTESGAVLLADGGMLQGDGVVIATGPWSRDFLPARLATKLRLKRQTMLSYVPRRSDRAWAASPAILGLDAERRDAWLMPPVAGAPARLSAASACRTVPELAGHDADPHWRAHLVARFGPLLTDFKPAAEHAADGYYLTDETSRGPMLAQLGAGPVWAYGACGGMSFKFAPVLAAVLAARATGRAPRSTGLESVDQPRRVDDRQQMEAA